MNRKQIIEAMARAIKIADGERPFGLYDYSKYPDPNASPPHVVRDEKTGKGILRSHDRDEASALFDRLTEQYVATAALTALETALPGLADVIAGKAVVVPVEASEAMAAAAAVIAAGLNGSGCYAMPGCKAAGNKCGCEMDAADIYRAMIEARPK